MIKAHKLYMAHDVVSDQDAAEWDFARFNVRGDFWGEGMQIETYDAELNNIVVLGSLIKSTYRYLHKYRRLYNLELTILGLLRKCINLPDKSAVVNFLNGQKGQFMELAKDPLTAASMEAFDYISWIESLTNKESLKSIIRKKTMNFFPEQEPSNR